MNRVHPKDGILSKNNSLSVQSDKVVSQSLAAMPSLHPPAVSLTVSTSSSVMLPTSKVA